MNKGHIGTQNITQLLNGIMRNIPPSNFPVAGIPSAIVEETRHNMGQIIKGLSFVTLFLTITLGGLLYQLTGSREILVGALAEVALCVSVLCLVYTGKISSAIFLTFILHSLSTLYFGLTLSPEARVQVMGLFLLGLVFLLFEGGRRWIGVGFIFAVITVIEVNGHIHFFRSLDLLPAHEALIGHMIVGTVMLLTCLMFYKFVREIASSKKKVNLYTSELRRTKIAMSKYVRENNHQVRIDLNVIYGYLQHLLSDAQEKNQSVAVEVRIRDLHAMVNATKSITEFINNSLEWSRIEQGLETPIRKETIDFGLWLDDMTERFKLMAKEKSVDLLLDAKNSPLYIFEDRNRLELILGNLLSNAVKFTAKNTIVLLRVGVQEDKLIFEVTDQGPGIPAEKMEHIFEPFATQYGTGIGLTVARELAGSLDGNIWVDSNSNVGSTFVLTLPLVPASYDQALQLKQSVNNTLTGLRVLVIDDDPTSQRITNINLQKLDYHVYYCETFEEAKLRLSESTIDLILLDYQLSGRITAVDQLKWIRSNMLTKNIPVIMLSGDALLQEQGDSDAKSLSLAAGANGYVLKPIDYKALVVEIEKVIDASKFKRYPWVN